MKGLDALEELRQNNIDNSHLFDNELLDIVEKELKDYEELKKVLEIIKEKDVDLQNFKNSCNCEDYNEYVINEKGLLTEKEYDLLEEWLKQ